LSGGVVGVGTAVGDGVGTSVAIDLTVTVGSALRAAVCGECAPDFPEWSEIA
jgi:hypothetical protein